VDVFSREEPVSEYNATEENQRKQHNIYGENSVLAI